MNRYIVIYHGNCADGFGAAWVVRKWLNEKAPRPHEVEYHAATYQETPPDVVGKHIIMVDFSYKRAIMEKLIDSCESLVIIDHHISAIKDLDNIAQYDYPKVIAVFDVNHSGAMLAWNTYFSEEDPPELLKRIEDRDLWRFKFSDTRGIQARLFSLPYDFELWDGLMMMSGGAFRDFGRQGEAIDEKHFKDIKEFSEVAVRDMVIGGVKMPVMNCSYMWGSDAANILAQTAEPKVAGYYYDTPVDRVFGLRSIGEFDCSEIAKKYGGGGHKNAAGFRVDPKVAQEFEIQGSPWYEWDQDVLSSVNKALGY